VSVFLKIMKTKQWHRHREKIEISSAVRIDSYAVCSVAAFMIELWLHLRLHDLKITELFAYLALSKVIDRPTYI
jgi:hypothetical protein